jgi:hypothetical protein
MTRTQTAVETIKSGGYFSRKLTDGYYGPKFRTILCYAGHRVVRGIGAATLDSVRRILPLEGRVEGNCVGETRYYLRAEPPAAPPPPAPPPRRRFVVEILAPDGCLVGLASGGETEEFWSRQPEAVRASRYRESLAQTVRLSDGRIGQPSYSA